MEMSSVVFFCESDSDLCISANKDWLKGASNKRIYAYLRIFDEEFEFEVWEPGKWNKFCVKVAFRKKTASLTINSMLIKNFKIQENYKRQEENILMMNSQDKRRPFREGFIEKVFILKR